MNGDSQRLKLARVSHLFSFELTQIGDERPKLRTAVLSDYSASCIPA